VTQATLKVVGAFHGLSRARSDARRYPAIDPLDSWTKYASVVPDHEVAAVRQVLLRGNEINQMMKVVGEEGTAIEDFLIYLKAEYIDAVYLQQDAYDRVDCATSSERQRHVFAVLVRIVNAHLRFDEKDAARQFFHRLTQATRDWNRLAMDTDEFKEQQGRLEAMLTGAGGHA
jgi:V/A-type H+-transporting ATPase subunit A